MPKSTPEEVVRSSLNPLLDGLPPDSPYSERAEQAAERFGERVANGEYNHLFKNPQMHLGR